VWIQSAMAGLMALDHRSWWCTCRCIVNCFEQIGSGWNYPYSLTRRCSGVVGSGAAPWLGIDTVYPSVKETTKQQQAQGSCTMVADGHAASPHSAV
jgi:hypothetical protein